MIFPVACLTALFVFDIEFPPSEFFMYVIAKSLYVFIKSLMSEFLLWSEITISKSLKV